MADKENLTPDFQENSTDNGNDTTHDEALQAFLESDTAQECDDNTVSIKKRKPIPKSLLWIIIGIIVLAVITMTTILLITDDGSLDPVEFDTGADLSTTVDGEGMHQASPVFDENGELKTNGYGELIAYTPSDIKQMDIKNDSGSFTVLAKQEKVVDEETGEESSEATVYTLKGYEDISMQSGGPDTIANDCCAVSFTSIVDPKGEKSSDFGFDKPKATVKTTFTDGTACTIIVGDKAPNQAGTYIMFGKNKTIYLVNDDEVDGLLFSVLDLMPLTINDAAANTDDSFFEKLTLSGAAFKETIEIKPNNDKAIDTSYVMTAPKNMFISEMEASSISGAIRGLYAQEAVCVNPDSSQLEKYGLKNPYVKLTAVYPDTTITLSASKPKDDSVYLKADNNIIYKIQASTIPWVETTVEKLTPDVVIDPNFESISKIVIKDQSGTYSFDTTTVSGDDDTSNITAIYKGKTLDADNFSVFYHNICNMKNAGTATQDGSGEAVLTVSISYSTGRATDTIKIYKTNSSKYIAQLNSQTLCLVYKSYCTKFSQSVQELITGKIVSSF